MMAGVALIAAAGLLMAQVSAAAAAPLIGAANALNWVMVHSVDPFARAGMASIRLPEYAGWASGVYGLYFLPLVLLAASLARWQPLKPPQRRKVTGSQTTGPGCVVGTTLQHRTDRNSSVQ